MCIRDSHRVVKSNGDIGGYAFGIDVKKTMLSKEGICIKKDRIENFKNIYFKF